MSYYPRAYWHDRAIIEGPYYVGPGGRPPLFAEERERIRALIRVCLKGREYHSLLDFGCGSGRFTALLSKWTDRYLGVDISRPGIIQARARQPDHNFTHLSGDEILIADDSVDLVVAILVFQHIVDDSDWEMWTKELRRVLSPGGHMLVVDAKPDADKDWHDHMRPRHPKEIAEAFGFRAPDTGVIWMEDSWMALLAP